jgi:hypothetical protein
MPNTPLTDAEYQALSAQIVREGRLIEQHMQLSHVHHEQAEQHRDRMYELIRKRQEVPRG